MVDFQKIIRATPEELKDDVAFQEQKDELHLHPELREYAIAGYLAQEIAYRMLEMFETCQKEYKEQIDLDAPPLTLAQSIGALQILAHALAMDMLEESPDPLSCGLYLNMQAQNYKQMVPMLRQHLNRARKNDDQG